MCNYLSTIAEFELLSDKQKKTIENFDKDINEFISLGFPFGIIKIYSNLAEKGLIKTEKLSEPKFLESLKYVPVATSLSEQEQKAAQDEITEVLEK